jgi:putative spermidine/putrescine transport system ATP-binding protein
MAFDLRLTGLHKRFGGFAAVDGIDLSVQRGEWLSLVGPSGCGKSTTLRMVAGFADPDAGHIEIKGRDVTGVPAHRRNTGMVFQNYALFPHMTVAENVAYGLKVRKVPAGEIARRVGAVLALVKLSGLEGRYATRELSGGQQQRVALARAIVIEPDVLLLDEPLSNLDARLREDLRVEMAELQRRLGITTIYVTHDQEEALSMSARVAVMNQGRLEQVGTPEEIYERPASLFVADFVGKVNTLAATVTGTQGREVELTVSGVRLRGISDRARQKGDAVSVAFRSERVAILAGAAADARLNVLEGTVAHVAYYGSSMQYRVRIADGVVVSVVETNVAQARLAAGAPVRLGVKIEDCLVLT